MKILKLATGFAIGYVLGTRAGREQYERIAEAARGLSGSPKVEQAKQKVKDTASAKLDQAADKTGAPRKARSSRPKPVETVPAAGTVTAGDPSPASRPGSASPVESAPL